VPNAAPGESSYDSLSRQEFNEMMNAMFGIMVKGISNDI
jgi:hypothetical protein